MTELGKKAAQFAQEKGAQIFSEENKERLAQGVSVVAKRSAELGKKAAELTKAGAEKVFTEENKEKVLKAGSAVVEASTAAGKKLWDAAQSYAEKREEQQPAQRYEESKPNWNENWNENAEFRRPQREPGGMSITPEQQEQQGPSKAVIFGVVGFVAGIPLSYFFQAPLIRKIPFTEYLKLIPGILFGPGGTPEERAMVTALMGDLVAVLVMTCVICAFLLAMAGYFVDQSQKKSN
jgi:hypothetical protein